VDPHISFWINDHSQGRKVPELGDVVNMARAPTFVLDHLECSGCTCIIDAQGVRSLCVCCCDCEITGDDEIGGCDVSEIMKAGWRGEVSIQGRVSPNRQVLRGCRGQYVQVTLDVAVAHL